MTKQCADCFHHYVKHTYSATCCHPASAGMRDTIARSEGKPCGPDGRLFVGDCYETAGGSLSDTQKTLLFFTSIGMFS